MWPEELSRRASFERPPLGFTVRDARDRVLLATAGLVARHDVSAVSTADISVVAGVDEHVVLGVGRDVTQCVFETATWAMHRALAVALHAYDRPGTWPERIRDAVEVAVSLLATSPDLVKLTVLVLPALGPRGLEHLFTVREPFTALLAPGVERLQRAGAPAADTAPAFVAGRVCEIVASYARAGGVPDLPETVPTIVRLILSPFCTQQEIDSVL